MTKLSMDDPYLDYYGFTHDPFIGRPPGFKFFPARRKPVLAQLHQTARNNHVQHLMQVVIGPAGSGKSLLRQALLATSAKLSIHSIFITPEQVGAQGVLGQAAEALKCSKPTITALLKRSAQLTAQGKSIYLVVDDAHQLDNEEILDLLTLATGNAEGRISVFLFADPILAPRLEALIPDRENYQVIPLQAYTLEETVEYLKQRLENANTALGIFSTEQVRKIHQVSAGWPGAINLAARQCLVEALPGRQKKTPAIPHLRLSETPTAHIRWGLPKLPWAHVAGVVIILALIAIAIFEDPASEDTALNATLTASTPEEPTLQEVNGNGQRIPLPLVAEDEPLVRDPLAAATGGESEQLDAAPAHITRTGTPPAKTPASTKQQATSPSTRSNTSGPPTTQIQVSAKLHELMAWYLRQPGSHFLLQVLGTRSEQAAQQILIQHGRSFHYFVKQHQGEPLYVVTYGNFPNRQAALSAADQLPSNLKAEVPWARSFSSVQQEIQLARR